MGKLRFLLSAGDLPNSEEIKFKETGEHSDFLEA